MENWDFFKQNVELAKNSQGELQKQQDIYAESWEAANKRVKASAQEIYSQIIDDKAMIKFKNFISDILDGVGAVIKSIGGVKGIILTTISIITPQITASLAGFQDKISVLFQSMVGNGAKAYEKTFSDLRVAAEVFNMNMRQSGTSMTDSQQYDLTSMMKLNELRAQYAREQDNMTEAEKRATQFAIEGIQAQQKAVVDLMEKQEEAATKRQEALASELELLKKVAAQTEENAKKEAEKAKAQNNTVGYKVGALEGRLGISDTNASMDLERTKASAKSMSEALSSSYLETKYRGDTDFDNIQKALSGMSAANNLEEYKSKLQELRTALQDAFKNNEELRRDLETNIDSSSIRQYIQQFGVYTDSALKAKEAIDKLNDAQANNTNINSFSEAEVQAFDEIEASIKEAEMAYDEYIKKIGIDHRTGGIKAGFKLDGDRVIVDDTAVMSKTNQKDVQTAENRRNKTVNGIYRNNRVDRDRYELYASTSETIKSKASKGEKKEFDKTQQEKDKNAGEIKKNATQIKAANESIEKSYDKVSKSMAMHNLTTIQGLTSLAGAFTGFGMSVRSVISIFDAWNNQDLSIGEKLISTFTSLGMLIPTVTSLIKNGKNVITAFTSALALKNDVTAISNVLANEDILAAMKSVGVKKLEATAEEKLNREKAEEILINLLNKTSLSENTKQEILATLATEGHAAAVKKLTASLTKLKLASLLTNPVFIIAAAAIAILAVGIKHCVDNANRYNEEAEKTAKTSETLKTMSEDAAEAVEKLANSFDKYKNAEDTLSRCVKGTKEWKEALEETNTVAQETLDQLQNYNFDSIGLKFEDLYTFKNGYLQLNKENVEKAQEFVKQKKVTTSLASAKADREVVTAQSKKEIYDTLRDTDRYTWTIDDDKIDTIYDLANKNAKITQEQIEISKKYEEENKNKKFSSWDLDNQKNYILSAFGVKDSDTEFEKLKSILSGLNSNELQALRESFKNVADTCDKANQKLNMLFTSEYLNRGYTLEEAQYLASNKVKKQDEVYNDVIELFNSNRLTNWDFTESDLKLMGQSGIDFIPQWDDVDHLYLSNFEELAKKIFEASGLEGEFYKVTANNEIKYKDANGKKQTISYENIGKYVAANAQTAIDFNSEEEAELRANYSRERGKLSKEERAVVSQITQNAGATGFDSKGAANEAVMDYFKSKSFGDMQAAEIPEAVKNYFNALYGEVFDNEFWKNIEDQISENAEEMWKAIDLKVPEDVKNKLSLEEARALKDVSEKAADKFKTFNDEKRSQLGSSENGWNGISTSGELTFNWEQNLIAKNSNNVAGVTEFINRISDESFNLAGEDSVQLMEQWAKELGVDISGWFEDFIIRTMNEIDKEFSLDTIAITEKRAANKKIVDKKKLGDTISAEDYSSLIAQNEELSDYFMLMDDGTYKLIKDADGFKKAVDKITLDKLLARVNNFNEVANKKLGVSLQQFSGFKSDTGTFDLKGAGSDNAIKYLQGFDLSSLGLSDKLIIKINEGKGLIDEELNEISEKLNEKYNELITQYLSSATTLPELKARKEKLESKGNDLIVTAEQEGKVLVSIASGYDECAAALRKYEIDVENAKGDTTQLALANEELRKSILSVQWKSVAKEAEEYAEILQSLSSTSTDINNAYAGIANLFKEKFDIELTDEDVKDFWESGLLPSNIDEITSLSAQKVRASLVKSFSELNDLKSLNEEAKIIGRQTLVENSSNQAISNEWQRQQKLDEASRDYTALDSLLRAEELKTATKAAGEYYKTIKQGTVSIEEQKEAANQWIAEMKKLNPELEITDQKLIELIQSGKGYTQGWKDLGITFEQYKTMMLSAVDSIKDLTILQNEAANNKMPLTYEEWGNAVARIASKYDDCTLELKAFNEAILSGDIDKIETTYKALINTMAKADWKQWAEDAAEYFKVINSKSSTSGQKADAYKSLSRNLIEATGNEIFSEERIKAYIEGNKEGLKFAGDIFADEIARNQIDYMIANSFDTVGEMFNSGLSLASAGVYEHFMELAQESQSAAVQNALEKYNSDANDENLAALVTAVLQNEYQQIFNDSINSFQTFNDNTASIQDQIQAADELANAYNKLHPELNLTREDIIALGKDAQKWIVKGLGKEFKQSMLETITTLEEFEKLKKDLADTDYKLSGKEEAKILLQLADAYASCNDEALEYKKALVEHGANSAQALAAQEKLNKALHEANWKQIAEDAKQYYEVLNDAWSTDTEKNEAYEAMAKDVYGGLVSGQDVKDYHEGNISAEDLAKKAAQDYVEIESWNDQMLTSTDEISGTLDTISGDVNSIVKNLKTSQNITITISADTATGLTQNSIIDAEAAEKARINKLKEQANADRDANNAGRAKAAKLAQDAKIARDAEAAEKARIDKLKEQANADRDANEARRAKAAELARQDAKEKVIANQFTNTVSGSIAFINKGLEVATNCAESISTYFSDGYEKVKELGKAFIESIQAQFKDWTPEDYAVAYFETEVSSEIVDFWKNVLNDEQRKAFYDKENNEIDVEKVKLAYASWDKTGKEYDSESQEDLQIVTKEKIEETARKAIAGIDVGTIAQKSVEEATTEIDIEEIADKIINDIQNYDDLSEQQKYDAQIPIFNLAINDKDAFIETFLGENLEVDSTKLKTYLKNLLGDAYDAIEQDSDNTSATTGDEDELASSEDLQSKAEEKIEETVEKAITEINVEKIAQEIVDAIWTNGDDLNDKEKRFAQDAIYKLSDDKDAFIETLLGENQEVDGAKLEKYLDALLEEEFGEIERNLGGVLNYTSATTGGKVVPLGQTQNNGQERLMQALLQEGNVGLAAVVERGDSAIVNAIDTQGANIVAAIGENKISGVSAHVTTGSENLTDTDIEVDNLSPENIKEKIQKEILSNLAKQYESYWRMISNGIEDKELEKAIQDWVGQYETEYKSRTLGTDESTLGTYTKAISEQNARIYGYDTAYETALSDRKSAVANAGNIFEAKQAYIDLVKEAANLESEVDSDKLLANGRQIYNDKILTQARDSKDANVRSIFANYQGTDDTDLQFKLIQQMERALIESSGREIAKNIGGLSKSALTGSEYLDSRAELRNQLFTDISDRGLGFDTNQQNEIANWLANGGTWKELMGSSSFKNQTLTDEQERYLKQAGQAGGLARGTSYEDYTAVEKNFGPISAADKVAYFESNKDLLAEDTRAAYEYEQALVSIGMSSSQANEITRQMVASAEGIKSEELEDYSETLKDLYGKGDETSKDFEQMAEGILITNKGIESLNSNLKEYQKFFKGDLVKGSTDWNKSLKGLKNDIGDIIGMDLDDSVFDADWFKANQKDIEKAAKGDEEAIQRLKDAAMKASLGEKIELPVTIGNPDDPTFSGTLGSMIDQMQAIADSKSVTFGTSIGEVEGMGDYINTLNELLAIGELTVDQVNDILQKIGFEPDIQYKQVSMGGSASADVTGVSNLNVGGQTVANATLTGDTSVSEEGTISIPYIDAKATKYSGKGGGASKPKSGGGGGGKKKAAEKKDTRYTTVNEQLADSERKLKHLKTASDMAWGTDKIAIYNQQLEEQGTKLDLLKQKYQETLNYLKGDKKALDNLGLGVKYDEDGTILNYDEVEDKMYNKYKMDSEAYTKAQKVLEQYVETETQAKDLLEEIYEQENTIKGTLLEKVEYELTYKIEINEDEFKILDYYLGKIDDDAFEAAKRLALLADQTDNLISKSDIYTDSLVNFLKRPDENGNNTFLTDEQIDDFLNGNLENIDISSVLDNMDLSKNREDLREYVSDLIETNESLQDMRDTIEEELLETFDAWNEKVGDSYDKFDDYASLLEHFSEIINIVGKNYLGISNTTMKLLDQTKVNNAIEKLGSSYKYLTELEKQRAQIQAQLDAGGDYDVEGIWQPWNEDDVKDFENSLKEIDSVIVEATENYYQDFEDALQGAMDQYTNAVEYAAEEFEKAMAPLFGSLDALQNALDRQNDLDDLHIEDFRQIYELSKLQRDINNSMDDTDNLKIKQDLAKIQQEINQYQEEGTELTEHDVEELRKRYELKLAEAQLDEAKASKSMVRMARDNEGNWGFIYTADEDEVANAEQNYEEKLYEYQRLNYDYIQDLQGQMIQLQQDMSDQITNIDLEELAARYANIEDYNERSRLITEAYNDEVAAITEAAKEKMQVYAEEMQETLDHQQTLYEEDWQAYHEATGYRISDAQNWLDMWNETALASIGGFETIEGYQEALNEAIGSPEDDSTLLGKLASAYLDWQEVDRKVFETAGNNIDTYSETVVDDIGEIQSASEELRAETESFSEEMTEMMSEVSNFIEQWKTNYSNSVESIVGFNEQLMESCEELIKKLNKTEEAQLSVGDNISDPDAIADGVPITPITPIRDKKSSSTKKTTPNTTSKTTTNSTQNLLITAIETAKNKINTIKTAATQQTLDNTIAKIKAAAHGKISVKTGGYTGKWVASAKTGMYTGSWNGPDLEENGRLAFLHQKELVLNANDTERILNAVDIVRTIDMLANAQGLGLANVNAGTINKTNDTLQQEVTIHAEFPNVQNRTEIEEAFNNLLGKATQYANR